MPLVIILLSLLSSIAQAGTTYDYPYTDPWLATTSAALVRAPSGIPHKQLSLTIKLRSGAQGRAPIPFHFYQQLGGGDLVVLIPGLDDFVSDPKTAFLAGLLYSAGHQVLVVPNDFTPRFGQGASDSGIVGLPDQDAMDMRNLLSQILAYCRANEGLQYSNLKITGFSLGALQAGFVSYQDSLATGPAKLGFTRTVLLNPPVDLWHGISALDAVIGLGPQLSLLTKGELDGIFAAFFGAGILLPKNDTDYYLLLEEIRNMPDINFQYLVGQDFLSGLQRIDPTVTSFTQYMQNVVIPGLATRLGYPTNLQALAERESLTTIAGFLKADPSVRILHNQDDILLQASDVEFMQQTFGSRLTLYPYGGHLGNMWFPQNETAFVGALSN